MPANNAGYTAGYAEINGAKIYYEVAGEGHPVVFSHAGVADSRMWDDQFAVFAKQYRAIRWDMRGYGNSEPVAGEYANREDLYALLKFLKVELTYLIGCSMGGGASMDFTLEHPEMVDALVMVASGPTGLDLDIPMPAKFADVEAAENVKDWDRMLEMEVQVWFDGEGRTPDQVDQVARGRLAAMNRRGLEHSLKELGKHKPKMQPGAAERLGDLHLPVLTIYGDRDTAYIQAAAQHMAEHISGAQKVLIPNTAHLLNMERPNEFNQIVLDFLSKIKHS